MLFSIFQKHGFHQWIHTLRCTINIFFFYSSTALHSLLSFVDVKYYSQTEEEKTEDKNIQISDGIDIKI